jgi:hypothetical protein
MSDLAEILRVDDRVLDLGRDIEVIQSLEILATRYRERQAEIAGLGPADVFEFIDSIANDEAFFGALDGIGFDGQELSGHVSRVSEALGRISDEQRKLIQPLSAFDEQQVGQDPGLVDWAILDAGTTAAGGAGSDYSFSLGASATMEFEAGDTWPVEGIGLPDPLLRLGLTGSLQATASAGLPVNGGSLTLSTENSLSSSIDYFFAPDAGRLYAAAIASGLNDLCNPFSLDSTWQAIARSSLRGVIAQVDGSTSLDLEVGIAEGFTIARDIADASVGLTVGARISRSAVYDLSIAGRPASGSSGQALEVLLTREGTRSRGSSIELGVEIDLAALADRLRQILKRHQQAYETVLTEYEDYLKPGTYLREQLSDKLDARVASLTSDRGVQDALKETFRKSLGLEQRPRLPKLKELLTGQITGHLDELGEVVTGRAELVAAELVQKIADEIGLNASEAIDGLVSETTSLVSDIQDDLTDKVTSLADSALEGLIEQLEESGAAASNAVNKADAALQGVRGIIGKYEGLLKKLIAETGNAARAKITARLTREEAQTSGRIVDLSMTITANTAATRKAFETVVRGDMNGILNMLRQPVPGTHFDRDNMALARFAEIDRTIGFDVVLLGFEFSTQSIFDADARVASDGAGHVSVTSNATWTKRKTTKREEREIQFVDTFELAAASATKQLNIDLNISHQDQDLHVEELKRFIGGFESARLLKEGITTSALDVIRGWNLGRTADKIKADIDLGLHLSHKSSLRLMQIGDRLNGSLNDAARKNLFVIAFRELVESGAYDMDTAVRLAERVLTQTRMGDRKPLIDVLYDYTAQLHDRTVGDPDLSPTFHGQVIRDLNRAHRLHELCMDFVDFVDIMGDVYEATPSLVAEEGWTESRYLDAQKQLNERLRNWLKIKSRLLFWIDDEAHPRTIAFVGALMSASGRGTGDTEGATIGLTLVRRNGDREVVTLA